MLLYGLFVNVILAHPLLFNDNEDETTLRGSLLYTSVALTII